MSGRTKVVVTLPITDAQADMAGMPASWLERAVNAVGLPHSEETWRPSPVAAPEDFKALLRKYGHHTGDCSSHFGPECYCGWEELKKRL